jgi:chemotaxis protein methyltransferase CheR
MKFKNELEERNFYLLKSRIFNDTSIDCHQYKENYLKRRIRVRMYANSLKTYGDYLKLLRADPAEYDFLLEDLTINVTQFFRDLEVFKLLEEEVFPLLIYNKVKSNRRVIRFWSAGCASGEEPYTVAIIMKELLGEEFANFMISIIGTDIDNKILTDARKGLYLSRQLENVNPVYLNRYFKKLGDSYLISDDIRDMVRYREMDLFADSKTAHFDVILCRNVMIYFTKDMQKKLFDKFHESLNVGGYLIIGKTETLMGGAANKFSVVDAKERIYQKVNIK